MLPRPEDEREYDVAARVEDVVSAFETRDSDLGTLLHLRWQADLLMQHVKMVHLSAPELVALIAVMAPVGHHPVIDDWDYGVRERVADAVKLPSDSGPEAMSQLRWELRDLMDTVKISDLSLPELVAMLAVLTAANGRRLLAERVEEALRPILRLVRNEASILDVDVAHLPHELTGAHVVPC